jgi:hypothetical protein
MRVYRMESADGWGAFETLPLGADGHFDDYSMTTHPTPWHDDELRQSPLFSEAREHEWRFGADSPEKLRHWFAPQTIPYLDAHGVQLTVWDVPDQRAASSRFQTIFDPSCATCVERLPADALYADELPLAA